MIINTAIYCFVLRPRHLLFCVGVASLMLAGAASAVYYHHRLAHAEE